MKGSTKPKLDESGLGEHTRCSRDGGRISDPSSPGGLGLQAGLQLLTRQLGLRQRERKGRGRLPGPPVPLAQPSLVLRGKTPRPQRAVSRATPGGRTGTFRSAGPLSRAHRYKDRSPTSSSHRRAGSLAMGASIPQVGISLLEASAWGWGESRLTQPPVLWGPQNYFRAEKGVWRT